MNDLNGLEIYKKMFPENPERLKAEILQDLKSIKNRINRYTNIDQPELRKERLQCIDFLLAAIRSKLLRILT